MSIATTQLLDVHGSPAVTVDVDMRTLLLVGAAPDAKAAAEIPFVASLMPGREVIPLQVKVGWGRHLSRCHAAIWMERGELRIASVQTNPLWIQPLGAARRATAVAGPPGEPLPVAATVWLPLTHPKLSQQRRRLAIVNPAAYRSRAQVLAGAVTGGKPTVTKKQKPPRELTDRCIDALGVRYAPMLVFPAVEQLPRPVPPADGNAREALRYALRVARERLQIDLGLDRDFLAHLLENRLLFLEDLERRHDVRHQPALADVAELMRRVRSERADAA
jgi:hypothetical protein